MKHDWIIAGKIICGVKQGKFFTQLKWFQEQCHEKLGFKPYPGTLNLEISGEYLTQPLDIHTVSPNSNSSDPTFSVICPAYKSLFLATSLSFIF